MDTIRANLSLQNTQAHTSENVINLGLGHPSIALLPIDLLRRAAAHRLSKEDRSILQYGYEQGDVRFRSTLAQFLENNYRMDVDPETLFITSGVSQILDLLCTLFCRAGDTVFVEEPTYFLALKIFNDHGLRVKEIPTTANGIDLDAFEEELDRTIPKFLYTIPTFQNPSGVTLPAKHRDRLVELGQEYHFLIIADEVYHLLSYDSPPPHPMAAYLDSGIVISLGSFSKILAPGLRLGWVQSSSAILDRIFSSGMLDSGGGLNPFSSSVIRSVIELGMQDRHLRTLKTVYNNRRLAMAEAVNEYLSDVVEFQMPRGGYYFWLKMSSKVDVKHLAEAARGVQFVPGFRFSSRGALAEYIRLSFSYYDEAQIREGVRRIARGIVL